MDKARKMCFDKILPRDLHRPHRATGAGQAEALALATKKWLNGSTIRICFLEGTREQIEMVKKYAPKWTDYANLKFEFTDDVNAQIRVTFNPNDGAWSYIGTDNLQIPVPQPTLNLGWQDEAVILHEFGHAIGMLHEHQNEDEGIQWNEDKVIKELSKPPNSWDPDTVRRNVLEKYSGDHIHGSGFDPDSIMLYAFPAEWTLDGLATHENHVLSPLDKDFIKSLKMYPPMDPADQRAIELELGRTAQAEISQAGEEDLYKLVAEQSGTYIVQTRGQIDVVMQLYGPDSTIRLVAEDDNSGIGRNALIEIFLPRGTYYVHVKHASPLKNGAYGILAFR